MSDDLNEKRTVWVRAIHAVNLPECMQQGSHGGNSDATEVPAMKRGSLDILYKAPLTQPGHN